MPGFSVEKQCAIGSSQQMEGQQLAAKGIISVPGHAWLVENNTTLVNHPHLPQS